MSPLSHSSTTCCLRLFTSGVAPSTKFNLRWFSCCRKILSLTLRSYFYKIRNMLFSYWSFKIVLSILIVRVHLWWFPTVGGIFLRSMWRHLTPGSGVLLLVLTGTVSIFESLAKIYIFFTFGIIFYF